MRQILELPLTQPSSDTWPNWLENCRIPDDALGEAYNHTTMAHRAGIKQCMALCQAFYTPAAEHKLCASADSGQGLWLSQLSMPAPWTLIIISPEYDAPARLTAAIMPMLLARVPHTALLCVDGMPQESLRTVLELTGLEDSFITTLAQAKQLISETAHQSGRPGRLLLLHRGSLAPLRSLAIELAIPCMEEASPPQIGILSPSSPADLAEVDQNALLDMEQLTFAHGIAGMQALKIKPKTMTSQQLDACYAQDSQLSVATSMASLALLPGFEACWLHTRLPHGFFCNTNIATGLCLPNTDFFSGGGYEGAD